MFHIHYNLHDQPRAPVSGLAPQPGKYTVTPKPTQQDSAFEPVGFLDIPFGLAAPDDIAHKTGLEQLQALLAGQLPAPTMARTMRSWIHAANYGHCEFRGEPGEDYLNPMGLVHGGWVMALLDSALGCAVQSTLAAAETFVSVGTEVKFIRPILPSTGQVRALADVDSRGSQIATATAQVMDQKGRLMATGTTTCFIRPMTAR